jgi:hypothetical protein
MPSPAAFSDADGGLVVPVGDSGGGIDTQSSDRSAPTGASDARAGIAEAHEMTDPSLRTLGGAFGTFL